LLSCAAAGMGVGIVPQILLDQYPFKDHIQSHVLPPKWRKSISSIIWRKDQTSSAIEIFSQNVKDNINVTS
jgi:DNA-binding transcriptional LysR family regulator